MILFFLYIFKIKDRGCEICYSCLPVSSRRLRSKAAEKRGGREKGREVTGLSVVYSKT